jgi:hypothetical protein
MALLDDGVNQTERLGLLRVHGFSRQHHRHRLDGIDQRRQPERPAEPRMQPKPDLGKTQLRIAESDAVLAGERDFEPTTEAMPVDDSHGRDAERRQPIDDLVRPPHARLDLARLGHALEVADVRTGNKAALLGRADDEALGAHALDIAKRGVEFGHHCLR